MSGNPDVELADVTLGALKRADTSALVYTAATIGNELRFRRSPDSIWGQLDEPKELTIIQAALVAAAAEEPEAKRPTGRYTIRAAQLVYEALGFSRGDTGGES